MRSLLSNLRLKVVDCIELVQVAVVVVEIREVFLVDSQHQILLQFHLPVEAHGCGVIHVG